MKRIEDRIQSGGQQLMVKCPFCQYSNEDGAIFCEQCKSDLGTVQPASTARPVAATAEPIPVAAVVGETAEYLADLRDIGGIYGRSELVDSTTDFAIPQVVAQPMVIAEAVAVAAVRAESAAPLVQDVAPPLGEPVASEIVAAPTLPAEALTVPMAETLGEGPEAGTPAPDAAVPAATRDQAAASATPTVGEAIPLPAGAQPRLVVLRGLKINVEYPLYEGHNFVGRADDKPVDIDLEDQEPPDRVWSSRQHALITYEEGVLLIEDLNSSNGTFVNRARIYPGQKRPLSPSDLIQIGTVQMKVRI